MYFRELYKKVRGYKIDNDYKKTLNEFPNNKDANCMIGYGYIDHDAGFTVEILCLAKVEKNKIKIFDGNNNISSKVRMNTSEIEGYYGNNEMDKELAKVHKEKIKIINTGYESKKLKKTREDEDLDEFRHSQFLDDVIVHFVKDGLRTEQCWVRLNESTEQGYKGILLNEPNQEFGIHMGEEVIVVNYVDSHGEKLLIANLSENKKEMMKFSECYSFAGKEKIKESYQIKDNYMIANISENKILDVINHFIVFNKGEKMFFILECPCKEQKEVELNKKIAEERGEEFNNLKMYKKHKDIYYADGLRVEDIIMIINKNIDILRKNGLISFGVGCHEKNDELMIEPYNIVTIYSKEIDKYKEFYRAHDIKKCKTIKTAWDLIGASNPGISEVLNSSENDIYSFIDKMKKEVGLNLAETREKE